MDQRPIQSPPAAQPQATPGTAAVVVTYNRRDLLVQCLQCLLDQSLPLERIYVIDNASTDGTPDVIPQHERIHYLRLPENLGGSYGFSKGVEHALAANHADLWLMDDDCLPERDAHQELILHRRESPVLCSAVLARDGHFDLHHRRRFDARRLREFDMPEETYAEAGAQVDLFTFVGVLISTELMRLAGLPVNDYFFMYDDSEYALRLLRLGVTARLVPSSRVLHVGSVAYPSPRAPYNPLKHYYNTRNQLLVYRQYGQSPAWFTLRFLVKTVGAYVRLAQHRELNRRSATLAALALRDAFRGRPFVRQFMR
jgi:rhamnopyranosyl-N-acetylglucosaminyl-diphospho-decaprenol beta-1,3/1,4-galactofuranosyltransferase